MLSVCSLLGVHYLVCSFRVHGWPIGEGPMQRLDLRFLEPLHGSVEISPGPDLYTEPGKSLYQT